MLGAIVLEAVVLKLIVLEDSLFGIFIYGLLRLLLTYNTKLGYFGSFQCQTLFALLA